MANALLAAEEPRDIFALERTLGASRYDPERSARFDQFVLRWLRTVNRGVYMAFRRRPDISGRSRSTRIGRARHRSCACTSTR
jgi:hypothetical protein